MGITDLLFRNLQEDPLQEDKYWETFFINFLTIMNSLKNDTITDMASIQLQTMRVINEALEQNESESEPTVT